MKRTGSRPWNDSEDGSFYLRVKVPEDLRDSLNKEIIEQNLNTYDYKEARKRFAKPYAELKEYFKWARAEKDNKKRALDDIAKTWLIDNLSVVESEASAREFFATADGKAVVLPEDLLVGAFGRGLAAQYRRVGKYVDSLLEDYSIDMSYGSEEHIMFTGMVCSRYLELCELAHSRYENDWKPNEEERVFSTDTYKPKENLSTVHRSKEIDLSKLTLGPLTKLYMKQKAEQGDWSDSTLETARRAYDEMLRYFSWFSSRSDITEEQLVDYALFLKSLPRGYIRSSRLGKVSFDDLPDLAEKEGLPLLSARTVKQKMRFVTALIQLDMNSE